MDQSKEKIFKTAVYLRLSHRDENAVMKEKWESDSILNQRAYIMNFLEAKPEFCVCGIFVDDGYSGTDFNRPQFMEMMDKIKDGEIDCIVVKDLSRFGRNYIDAGKYIERLFPLMGVRFIAINDNYDSQAAQENIYDIILPFKNLINDAYCRDISVKIRSHLEIKRKKGEFVGAFSVYGYKKAEKNKNQLVVDECAAEIVRRIFKMRINGMSNLRIADKLNTMGILSPLEYKKQAGFNYVTSFQKNIKAKWSAASIDRILKNKVYTGLLIQGKEESPNFKIKKRIKKPENEWSCVADTHEPIISKHEFEVMQRLLKEDTRILAGESAVALFAGCLQCADCGSSMVRKKIPAPKKADGANKKYVYYICSGNKSDKSFCSPHRINEERLTEAVQCTFRAHFSYFFLEKEAHRWSIGGNKNSQNKSYLNIRMKQISAEIENLHSLKISLMEDLHRGIINKEECYSFRKELEQEIKENEISFDQLANERKKNLADIDLSEQWLKQYIKSGYVSPLNRSMVVHLISRILIFEDNCIKIEFRYGLQEVK